MISQRSMADRRVLMCLRVWMLFSRKLNVMLIEEAEEYDKEAANRCSIQMASGRIEYTSWEMRVIVAVKRIERMVDIHL